MLDRNTTIEETRESSVYSQYDAKRDSWLNRGPSIVRASFLKKTPLFQGLSSIASTQPVSSLPHHQSAFYLSLSKEEQQKLTTANSNSVFIKSENKATTPIYTAYALIDCNSPSSIAEMVLNIENATSLFPKCKSATETSTTEAKYVTYNLEAKTGVGLIATNFQEKLSLKIQRKTEKDFEEITFQQLEESNYLKSFQGNLRMEPHESKILLAYTLSVEPKEGLIKKFLPLKAIEATAKRILKNIIVLVEKNRP